MHNEPIETENTDEKMPHSEIVGVLIALVVISIAMEGIGLPGWISAIPIVALSFSLVAKIVEYFKNREARINYQYHKEFKDVLNIWVAAIIISIVMGALFHREWFAAIPITVLNIKAVEITIVFLVAQSQKKQRELEASYEHQPAVYVQPVQVIPTVQYPDGTSQQTVVSNYQEEIPMRIYCQHCGGRMAKTTNFCPHCGGNLN